LVLLIIFIVTARIVVTPAIAVNLPQAANGEDVQTVLAVAVGPDGALSVNGTPCPDGELTSRARRALAEDPELRAVIQADGDVPHRRVLSLLDRLEGAGVTRVAFGTRRADAAEGTGDPAGAEQGEGT
ncbi:MAG: ExbD/TolR family protein, partial [Myxococcota bacterium]